MSLDVKGQSGELRVVFTTRIYAVRFMTALITIHHVQAVNIRNIWTHVMANDSQGQGVCVCVCFLNKYSSSSGSARCCAGGNERTASIQVSKWICKPSISLSVTVFASPPLIAFPIPSVPSVVWTSSLWPLTLSYFGLVILPTSQSPRLFSPPVLFQRTLTDKQNDASFGWFHSGDPISSTAHTPTAVSVSPPLSVVSLLASCSLSVTTDPP